MEHELTLVGSIINHLPAAVFRLYAILQQNYAGQYEVSGDDILTYRQEENAYESAQGPLTPMNTIVTVSYAETAEAGRYLYGVRLCRDDAQDVSYSLQIACGIAFLQQYYYPVRRFLRANPAKYVRPGMSQPPREGMCVAVIDTEMQRPYITQFSGRILRYQEGIWTMDDAECLNVYFRLPEGVQIDPFVRKVTGFTRAFLDENGIAEEEALQQVSAFLAGAEIICGHAVLSDIEIIRERDLLVGEAIPDCLSRQELIDTQVLMEYLYDLSGMIKLERAAELAGVASDDDVFHDARTDADVTARLFVRLYPEFVDRFGVTPIVKAPMMHAPKDTALLNAILGKRVPVRSADPQTGGKSQKQHRNTSGTRSVRRTVRTEQKRRGRIT